MYSPRYAERLQVIRDMIRKAEVAADKDRLYIVESVYIHLMSCEKGHCSVGKFKCLEKCTLSDTSGP